MRGQDLSLLVPENLEEQVKKASDMDLIIWLANIYKCNQNQIYIREPRFSPCWQYAIDEPVTERLLVNYEYWYE